MLVLELGSEVDSSQIVHTGNGYNKEDILVSWCVRSSIIISIIIFPCISKTNSNEISCASITKKKLRW